MTVPPNLASAESATRSTVESACSRSACLKSYLSHCWSGCYWWLNAKKNIYFHQIRKMIGKCNKLRRDLLKIEADLLKESGWTIYAKDCRKICKKVVQFPWKFRNGSTRIHVTRNIWIFYLNGIAFSSFWTAIGFKKRYSLTSLLLLLEFAWKILPAFGMW